MPTVLDNLSRLGIELPEAPKAVANYLAAVRAGDMVYISGQLPMKDGKLQATGRLGANVSLDEGYAAARQCAVNALAALSGVIDGRWESVAQVVRLGGFVASADGFNDQPKVVNGASDLMVEVFGEKGRHARAAVGVNELPLGAAVEVEFLFRLQES